MGTRVVSSEMLLRYGAHSIVEGPVEAMTIEVANEKLRCERLFRIEICREAKGVPNWVEMPKLAERKNYLWPRYYGKC